MNWKKIAKKYPKSFMLLQKRGYISKTTDDRKYIFTGYHIRELYDFFDGYNIIITVYYDHEGTVRNTRLDAEKNAFKCAFKALEGELIGCQCGDEGTYTHINKCGVCGGQIWF